MTLRLFYREAAGSAPNTFTARLDGPVLLVTAHIKRTDAADYLILTLPCWVDERGRRRPPYDRPLFALYRQSGDVWRLPGLVLGPGDACEAWLVDVPEDVGSAWWKAGQ